MNKYVKEIQKIESEIENLQKRKMEIVNEWKIAEHPLKIDQEVKVNEYAHRNKKMIVKHLDMFQEYSGEWLFTATGCVIKNDGTMGKVLGGWRKPAYTKDMEKS